MRKFKIGDVVKIINTDNIGDLRRLFIKQQKQLIITGYLGNEIHINHSKFSFFEDRFKRVCKVNYLPDWF